MTLKLKGATNGSVSLQAPATTTNSAGSDKVLVLPQDIGSAGQVLRNSSTPGTLEFGTISTPSVEVGTSFFYVFDNSGTTGTNTYENIGNASSSIIIFENVGSDYDGTTNKGRYTAPADGLYRFFAVTSSNSVTSGLTINVQFTKNGSGVRTFENGDPSRSYNNNGDAANKMGVQTQGELVLTLSSGDFIECKTKFSGSPNNSSHTARFDRRGLFGGYRLN